MFARLRQLVFNLSSVFIALVVLSSFLLASYQMETWPFGDHRTLRERHQFVRVTRTVLEPVLKAPGRVESSRRTVVRCELENMTSTGGSSANSGTGSSTMIWVIPEATAVKQGEVIARLDASTYEEMLRQQAIVVEQAKASYVEAELNLDIAKIAMREYLEGTVKELIEEMEANLSLAKSNLTQAGQRLEWSRKMKQKGYASIATIKTEEQNFMTTQLALQKQETTYDLFKLYTYPKNQKTLQADITTAQTTLDNEQVKRNKQVERFETLKKQVDRCTIRAPHDGVVYYYVDANPRRGPNQEAAQIQEGMSVRQEQKLFFLPDLSEMEVQVVLNESIVNRVSPGLTANVDFEALPGTTISGKLLSVSEIPNQTNQRGEDVRYFMGILKLERSADGLKPGMSAIVTLTLPRGQDSLVVPPAAVVADQGRYSCYLPVADHLELRDVKVGRTTPEVIEITDGLTEGDEVALDPPTTQATSRPKSLAGFDSRPWPKEAFAKTARGSEAGPPARRSYGNGESRQGKGTPGKPTRKSRKRADDDA